MKKLLLVFLPFIISCSRSGKTVNPLRKDIIETVYASGKIIPANEYHVFALSNGTVKEKLVKEGDSVKAGSLLYKINSDASAGRLDAARSMLQNSEANLSPDSRVLNDIKFSMESADVK